MEQRNHQHVRCTSRNRRQFWPLLLSLLVGVVVNMGLMQHCDLLGADQAGTSLLDELEHHFE